MKNWISTLAVEDIDVEVVGRCDHGGQIDAIYRAPNDKFYATDGRCTHAKDHLADGSKLNHTIEGGHVFIDIA